eukprot:2874220-Rhodomonas_salina.7
MRTEKTNLRIISTISQYHPRTCTHSRAQYKSGLSTNASQYKHRSAACVHERREGEEVKGGMEGGRGREGRGEGVVDRWAGR